MPFGLFVVPDGVAGFCPIATIGSHFLPEGELETCGAVPSF